MDGLDDGPLRDAVGARLKPLKSLASASLAVLNAVAGSGEGSAAAGEVLAEVVDDMFPSWVPARDRALLSEAAGAVKADVVVRTGAERYVTVKEAVDAAPDGGGKSRYVIHVNRDVYKENVEVGLKKRELMIVGDGMDATVITGSRNVVDGSTTFNSATLSGGRRRDHPTGPANREHGGAEKHQAVALHVSADRAVVYRCRIDGYEDTLYAHTVRQFYCDSTVSGTVDFVFGNAAAVLELHAGRAAADTGSAERGHRAGPGGPEPEHGHVPAGCRVVPGPAVEGVLADGVQLYMQSYLGAHIDPNGWLEWDGELVLKTLFYGEYRNERPVAGTANRVRPGYHVITDRSVAMQFTVGQFIQGGNWLKGTGVDYNEGL